VLDLGPLRHIFRNIAHIFRNIAPSTAHRLVADFTSLMGTHRRDCSTIQQ